MIGMLSLDTKGALCAVLGFRANGWLKVDYYVVGTV